MARAFPHKESLLQFIWEKLLFDSTSLRTTCGQFITIHNPGERNHSDGPDFKNASIRIDGITWHGAIEIHTQASDWYAHGHQSDPNYNQVILHVIAGGTKQAICDNEHQPLTLNLLPYLPQELASILKHYHTRQVLACSGNVVHLNLLALEAQLAKAKKEYFDKKVTDFYSFFPASLPPIQAWKYAYILSFFDGLGISKNRIAMREAGKACLDVFNKKLSFDEFSSLACTRIAELEVNGMLQWNHKGVRPANHPSVRLKQGILFTFKMLSSFSDITIKTSPQDIWENWCNASHLKIKNSRIQLLYQLVHLPATYALGSILHSERYKKASYKLWLSSKSVIPLSIKKLFPIEATKTAPHLGLVHQYNAYCKPRRCSECFVLKSAIHS